jgi:hypothetical protein
MCVFLCQRFPTFPVAENPIGHLMSSQRYAGALTLPHVVDNRRVAMDVPSNGRYVTLVGGAIGTGDYQTARLLPRIHSRKTWRRIQSVSAVRPRHPLCSGRCPAATVHYCCRSLRAAHLPECSPNCDSVCRPSPGPAFRHWLARRARTTPC